MTKKSSSWKQADQRVTPFWRRMPTLFLFPLYTPALVRCVAYAVLLALLARLCLSKLLTAPLSATLLFMLGNLALSLAITRYGFLVVDRTAKGWLDPRQYPPVMPHSDSPYRMYKLFGIISLAAALIGVVTGLFKSPMLALILMLLLAILVPASMMVLTLTDDFLSALNPLACLVVISKIGAPYFALCLFLFLLMIGSQTALGVAVAPTLAPLMGEGLPAGIDEGATPEEIREAMAAFDPQQFLDKVTRTLTLIALLAGFIGNYFMLLMCALIGYVMYQYSQELEISVEGPGDHSAGAAAARRTGARSQRESMVGEMIAAGEFKEAASAMREDLSERPRDLALHGRYHKLLVMLGDPNPLAVHTDRYAQLLLDTDNSRQALEVARQARQRDPSWRPRESALVLPLARAALDSNDAEFAAALLDSSGQTLGSTLDDAQWRLLQARLLLVQGRPVNEARVLLERLVAAHPNSVVAAEARRYLARLPGATPAA
jgi:hypothetical protein